jgi:hypothetical protein
VLVLRVSDVIPVLVLRTSENPGVSVQCERCLGRIPVLVECRVSNV